MSSADRISAPGTLPTQRSGAILLAAGFSRRFGSVKLQARLPDGRTLLQHCFNNLLQATENIIIVGREDLLNAGVYDFLSTPSSTSLATIKLVLCEDAELGMGHSLACAARQLPTDWQSTLICLGDMPLIQPDTLKIIIAASTKNKIVIPVWQSQRGHPVSFGGDYFAALAASHGDAGARQIIKQHPSHVLELDTHDQGVLQDIDTPEAFKLLTVNC